MELTAKLADKETELAEARKESKKLRNVPIYCIKLFFRIFITSSVMFIYNLHLRNHVSIFNRKAKNWNKERQTE